jgi:hypothetical protein
LKPYPKALAECLLEEGEENDYYPSFLLEDEIIFLEIIEMCHAKSQAALTQTDNRPSKE